MEPDDNENRVPDVPLMIRLLRQDGVRTCGGCARSKALAEKWSGLDGVELIHELGLPTSIPIVLPYNDEDLNFPHSLAWYRGRRAFCIGDSVEAKRLAVIGQDAEGRDQYGDYQPHAPCGNKCENYGQPGQCSPTARLKFLLAGSEQVGGCYEFRTKSWNSIANIHEALGLISTVTHGTLSWIPLIFEVTPQKVQPKNAPANTAMIARVSFEGGPGRLIAAARENLALQGPLVHEQKALEAGTWDVDPEYLREFEPDVDDAIDVTPTDDGDDSEGSTGVQSQEPKPEVPAEPSESTEAEPATTPEMTGSEVAHADATERRMNRDEQLTLWRTCIARAKKLDQGKDPKLANKLLRAVLDRHQYERSQDAPVGMLDKLVADADNVRWSEEGPTW